MAAGAGAAGQRWYTAEQTTPLLPGARTIPAAVLRNDRRRVRHPDEPCAQHGGGGERYDRVRKLYERDVELQLHRRQQQRRVRDHRPEAPRAGTGGLCDVNGRIASKFRALGAMGVKRGAKWFVWPHRFRAWRS